MRTVWQAWSREGLRLLTERARLARGATTAAAEADAATATKTAAAAAASGGGSGRGSALDTAIADVTSTRTPVGRNYGAAQATAENTSRNRSREAATGGTDANRAVVDSQRTLLLNSLLLPPGRVSVEQAQLLLGLTIVGHLMLVLATLLGEGASAIVDPLVAVDLLATGAAAGCSAAMALGGQGAVRGAIKAAGGQDESAAAGSRG